MEPFGTGTDPMHGRLGFTAKILVVACNFCLWGCGWWNGHADEVEEDPVLTADDPAAANEVATTPEAPKQKLELNLKPGDRFPLLKTVEHILRKPSPEGWTISRSNIEMLL